MSKININDNLSDYQKAKDIFDEMYKSLGIGNDVFEKIKKDTKKYLENNPLFKEYQNICNKEHDSDTDALKYAFSWLTSDNCECNDNTKESQSQSEPTIKKNIDVKQQNTADDHKSPYVNLFPGYDPNNKNKDIKYSSHVSNKPEKKCCCDDNKHKIQKQDSDDNITEMLKRIMYTIVKMNTDIMNALEVHKSYINNEFKKIVVDHDNKIISKLKHDIAIRDKEIDELNKKIKYENDVTNMFQSFFGDKTPS